MSIKTKLAALAVATISVLPANAEEYYFRGFTEIFSAGICAMGPGECYSYLNVDSAIADACAYPNKREPVKVAGHSMGTGAAMRFTWEVSKCGRNVSRVVFMDALTHPYDMPKNTKWVAYHTSAFSAAVEGMDKGNFVHVGDNHLTQTFNPALRARARAFMDAR